MSEIQNILDSGKLAYGSYTKKIEEKLKNYFNTPYIIVTSTFESAILVAITTLGIDPKENIIASPMACLASTQPYLSKGINVYWADVDPNTQVL